MRELNKLITAHPDGVSSRVNYIFISHVVSWFTLNLAGESIHSFMVPRMSLAYMHASLLGVWVGVGRDLTIVRAFVAICCIRFVYNEGRYDETDTWMMVVFGASVVTFLVADTFGYRFEFQSRLKTCPKLQRSQYSLLQIFAATTAIALMLGGTKFLQYLFGDEVWMLVSMLLLNSVVMLGSCVGILSGRAWIIRSVLAIISAVVVCWAIMWLFMQLAQTYIDVPFAVFASSIWILILAGTFAVLRAAGYRFGRFESSQC